MNPRERLNNSYNEELIYLDNIIRTLTTNVTVNRNLDIGIINALSAAFVRREQVLKSQIYQRDCQADKELPKAVE